MSTRETAILEFLARTGLEAATREKMGSDASFRRYERLIFEGKSHILMDAPPPEEDVRPFLYIGKHLISLGLSAPNILAENIEEGLLLLEDLGDDRYSRVLAAKPALEKELYTHATEVLAFLHKAPLPAKLPVYDESKLIEHVLRFTEWYLPHLAGMEVTEDMKAEFTGIWMNILLKRGVGPEVLALWDFHADNLMWLPARDGIRKVGLLDFQDAMSCPPTYDLVSLLQDCRRPISPDIEPAMLKHYLQLTGLDKETFEQSYAIIGAQRHTRILGTFARLAIRDKKPGYLQWIPKEWDYLEQNLEHPALAELTVWFAQNVPQEKRRAA